MSSHISINCTKSVVNLCDQERLNPIELSNIRKANPKGLTETATLSEHLSRNDYIPVLYSIWSERNQARRLEWLKLQAPSLHAPLLFEQAIAEFAAAPTVDTINTISFPLMKVAGFRVSQDMTCSTDPSVSFGDAAVRLTIAYQSRLEKLVKKHLNKSLAQILTENKDIRMAAIEKKAKETIQASLSCQLPLPDWIGWHGMSVFVNGVIKMHPASKYKELRDAYATKILDIFKPKKSK